MESVWVQAMHGVSTVGVLAILGITLNQHKIFVRMKDRLNVLWFHHCKSKDEPFTALENGNK